MTTIFNSLNKDVKDELINCFSSNDIEKIFDKYEVYNFSDKTKALMQTMGVKESYGSHAEMTDEEEYNIRLYLFLKGTWRRF